MARCLNTKFWVLSFEFEATQNPELKTHNRTPQYLIDFEGFRDKKNALLSMGGAFF